MNTPDGYGMTVTAEIDKAEGIQIVPSCPDFKLHDFEINCRACSSSAKVLLNRFTSILCELFRPGSRFEGELL